MSREEETSDKIKTCIENSAYSKFAKETSAHGFRWTVGCPDKFRAWLWGSLIMAALSVAAFSVYSVTKDYIRGPNFSSEYNLVSSPSFLKTDGRDSKLRGVQLPDIVICNPNPWDESKIQKLNISYELVSYMTYVFNPFMVSDELLKPNNSKKLMSLETQYNDLLALNNGSQIKLLESITVECKDFVIGCKIGLDLPLRGPECCSTIFNLNKIFTYDGICFSTVDKFNFRVMIPSKTYGIRILVTSGNNIYDKMDQNIYNWMSIARDGVSFAVLDNSDHPTVALMQRGKGARMNAIADIPILRETIDFSGTKTGFLLSKLLNRRNSDCIEDSKMAKRLVPGFKHFSAENCKASKLQKHLNDLINCNILALPPRNRKLPICSPLQAMKTNLFFQMLQHHIQTDPKNGHEEKFEDNYFQFKFMKEMDKVIPEQEENSTEKWNHKKITMSKFLKIKPKFRCPTECHHNIYSPSISSFDLSDTFKQNLVHLFNFSSSQNAKFAILDFYYPTFDFIRIVQHYRGPLEWLADVGGSLGLYLGASVFTIVELFWFCGEVLHRSMRNLVSRNNQGF